MKPTDITEDQVTAAIRSLEEDGFVVKNRHDVRAALAAAFAAYDLGFKLTEDEEAFVARTESRPLTTGGAQLLCALVRRAQHVLVQKQKDNAAPFKLTPAESAAYHSLRSDCDTSSSVISARVAAVCALLSAVDRAQCVLVPAQPEPSATWTDADAYAVAEKLTEVLGRCTVGYLQMKEALSVIPRVSPLSGDLVAVEKLDSRQHAAFRFVLDEAAAQSSDADLSAAALVAREAFDARFPKPAYKPRTVEELAGSVRRILRGAGASSDHPSMSALNELVALARKVAP